MTTELTVRPREAEPLILVVDDDRRVRELLEIAFGAQGYRVITAADGEEAVRRSLGEHPDLVVLDVRLPKRSGLEVCEMLRHDAEGRHVPIVVVSAATEGETRLQAFHRGADDYLVKPFSPRELLARVKRLLARVEELRRARERGVELERDAARAREDVRRAQRDLEASGRRADFVRRVEADFAGVTDPSVLAGRVLGHVQRELGVAVAALLVAGDDGALEPWAIRGDAWARLAPVGGAGGGELAAFLAARGTPVSRASAERLRELAADLAPIAQARFEVLAPIRDDTRLVAVVLAEAPRGAGARHAEALHDLARLAALPCAAALRARARVLALAELVLQSVAEPDLVPALDAAADAVTRAARALRLPPPARDLARLAVLAGPDALDPARAYALQRLQRADDAGIVADLVDTMAAAHDPEATNAGEARALPRLLWEPDPVVAARPLVAAGWQVAAAVAGGASLSAALHDAAAAPDLDPAVRRALEREARAAGPAPPTE